jgi:hypothetical protein
MVKNGLLQKLQSQIVRSEIHMYKKTAVGTAASYFTEISSTVDIFCETVISKCSSMVMMNH